MSPARYGDMDAFLKTLKTAGYEESVPDRHHRRDFMGKKEASWLGLVGSTLLAGKK